MSDTKFIVIIRPPFMQFCGDGCRSAAFNHLLYRIAGKSKDQPKEKIQAGDILWYAKTEQITEEMANAWGVCKVRKEVNGLIDMGIIGRRSNPAWGADRTKHFCFGQEECARFLQLCEKHKICVVHLDLPPEVMHLIYSSNANDKSIKCICAIHQMEMIEVSNANDKSITAITKDSPTKIDSKEESNEGVSGDTAIAQSPETPDALFAYQIVGYEDFYYHEFCNSAQDRGCNDGLTFSIKPLSAVPVDAICDICYGKMHEPHQYPVTLTSMKSGITRKTDPKLPAITASSSQQDPEETQESLKDQFRQPFSITANPAVSLCPIANNGYSPSVTPSQSVPDVTSIPPSPASQAIAPVDAGSTNPSKQQGEPHHGAHADPAHRDIAPARSAEPSVEQGRLANTLSASVDPTPFPVGEQTQGGATATGSSPTGNESRAPGQKPARGKKPPQPPLLPPQEPDMSGAWIAEQCVLYAEWRNGAMYRETERARQLEHARAIHRDDPEVTLLQFKAAYERRKDAWWDENVGKLHVSHLRGKEKGSGIDRLHSMLDRIAAEQAMRRNGTNGQHQHGNVRQFQSPMTELGRPRFEASEYDNVPLPVVKIASNRGRR